MSKWKGATWFAAWLHALALLVLLAAAPANPLLADTHDNAAVFTLADPGPDEEGEAINSLGGEPGLWRASIAGDGLSRQGSIHLPPKDAPLRKGANPQSTARGPPDLTS